MLDTGAGTRDNPIKGYTQKFRLISTPRITAADAIYVADAATGVQVRLGALEDVQRSEGEEIGLRVFVGKQSASASSSDLSVQAMEKLAERAVAMAGQAPEDEYAGLAPQDRLMTGTPASFDIDDGGDVSPQDLRARALQAEDAARAVHDAFKLDQAPV
jgi:PmbA protein